MTLQAVAAGCTIFFGYVFFSSALQYLFYYKRSGSVTKWKTQPHKNTHVGIGAGTWWFSIWNTKSARGPYHLQFTTFNLIFASLSAYFITEWSAQGKTKMQFDPVSSYGWFSILCDFMVAVIYESVVEYYWHRLMHLRLFYGIFHKYHHFYKSPEPFDDMYIHPVEAIGYYCILFGPPLIFKIHYISFIAYMIIMGLCGVLDHSGISLACGIYDTVDHDLHHEKFDVNYSFPFPILDILHGTYHGTYLGITRSIQNDLTKRKSH